MVGLLAIVCLLPFSNLDLLNRDLVNRSHVNYIKIFIGKQEKRPDTSFKHPVLSLQIYYSSPKSTLW